MKTRSAEIQQFKMTKLAGVNMLLEKLDGETLLTLYKQFRVRQDDDNECANIYNHIIKVYQKRFNAILPK